ncbi:basic Helix-Loop-Helix 11 [Hibiscus trionum]|uniref:Basic Helix-Loop-Helix 11 n=1 Tax=Hibiscus trionum TaxID=183268 RepID=A0A9W7GWY8_HIBTR|nr:basic Helix-Loop-Helix 11 [Hibiscus trionum]
MNPDKVTVLVDTTQMLKDLTADSGEEKLINIQYHQRLSVMFPWTGIDPAVVVANPCSTFMPYSTTPHPPMEQPSSQHASSSDLSFRRDIGS